ncbi:MAG TPA: ornithine carbamoyltransferase [Bryobacteraceae bacterium]
MTAPSLARFNRPPHVTTDLDLEPAALSSVLHLAAQTKRTPLRFSQVLAGRYLSLLFEKPSLRTRLTFELAMKQLGGDAVHCDGRIGERDPVKDMARNLDRWTHCIAARVYSHSTIEELTRWSSVPVINALSDLYHPCQILADMQTIHERFGRFEKLKLAFIGDGNNVAHSLMLTGGRLGIEIAVATPKGYGPNRSIVAEAARHGSIALTCDPVEAVEGAHVVYTDVWVSMGQEAQAEDRARAFAPYQVDETLFARARPEAVFMHCLPARRGQEVTDGVIEGPRSVVFDQAENRLHAQKALLLTLLQ